MTKTLTLFFLLLSMTTAGVGADPLRLSLPSADSYCYWVQSGSGPVTQMPVSVNHRKIISVRADVAAGDHLLVMDAHTGEVASRLVSLTPAGVPLPISLAVSDFLPVSAPAVAAAAPMPSAAPSAPPNNKLSRLLTGLFSLVLAGGVGWLVWHLVQTRGEPLRDLARRAGVEVAAPVGTDTEAAEPPTYLAPRRAPEPVPDDAGLPPRDLDLVPRLARGPEIALADAPALLGLQGLAAGSTFALSGGDLTVGRDGDNEIVLAENTVSRRHARLLRDSHGQFTVTDLGSANGVYLNGERVQRAILTPGDEIKIGDNYFRFQAAKGNQ